MHGQRKKTEVPLLINRSHPLPFALNYRAVMAIILATLITLIPLPISGNGVLLSLEANKAHYVKVITFVAAGWDYGNAIAITANGDAPTVFNPSPFRKRVDCVTITVPLALAPCVGIRVVPKDAKAITQAFVIAAPTQ